MHVPPVYPYVTPRELRAGGVARTQVLIVGAGPVGMACAIDLAQHGVDIIIIDDNNTVSAGSRAICWAKRTLEILDRLGCGGAVCNRGVSWNVGKVFFRDKLAYQFDLLPEPGHKRPAFVNLQQYLLEEIMVERLRALGGSVRWKNKAIGVAQRVDGARVEVETPDGRYAIEADYVIAADGAHSAVRDMLGLAWKGQVFRDRFLIADVSMRGDFPTERWFWFEPPFHPGGSALLHKQADDIWRIDLQLGWDCDPDEEKKPEHVTPRIRAMLGDRAFQLEWVSVYTFQCARLERFIHDHIIFAGDAAHQVSPFGARGGNSGIQDADNLCWKLARVVRDESPVSFLQTYNDERIEAADENILNSSRSTDFITPKSGASRKLRDAVLALSKHHPFARRLVNSGRLSTPTAHRASVLATPDDDAFACMLTPGAPAIDAPLRIAGRTASLLDQLGGRFDLLVFDANEETADALESEFGTSLCVARIAPDRRQLAHAFEDIEGLATRRYDAEAGAVYLLRPDQHVAARWRKPAVSDVGAALRCAQGIG